MGPAGKNLVTTPADVFQCPDELAVPVRASFRMHTRRETAGERQHKGRKRAARSPFASDALLRLTVRWGG